MKTPLFFQFCLTKKTAAVLACFLVVFSFLFPSSGFAAEAPLTILEKNLSLLTSENPKFLTEKEALHLLEQLESHTAFTVSEHFKQFTKAHAIHNQDQLDKGKWLQFLVEQTQGNFHRWSLEDQHRFDMLMVALGILTKPVHLDPRESILTQEEILSISMESVVATFDTPVEVKDFVLYQGIYTSFYFDESAQMPLWKVTFRYPSPNFYLTVSSQGEVFTMEMQDDMEAVIPSLAYLSELEEEKGPFQFWSLEDKAWLSGILPALIDKEENQGNTVLPTIYAIAGSRFILPTKDVISQETALQLAQEASSTTFQLPNHWLENLRWGSSFYNNNGTLTWRITFWPGSDNIINDYYGGLVEIDALTGEIIFVERHGNTLETSIPYEARL